jgi:uncharacterized protein YegJ (DUF2314 family)
MTGRMQGHSNEPTMNRTTTTLAALLAFLSFLFIACSKQDKVINVQSDDAEMVAAIAKARASLPEFWQVFEKRERGESDFSLKVRITDQGGTEHFWATDIKRQRGKTVGTIDNDPNIVTSVKLGDTIEISDADISDWLYLRDGKMVGNETLRPLLKRMPPAEADELRKMMANP